MLWHLCGIHHDLLNFPVSNIKVGSRGIDPAMKYRGLTRLEKAGLIAVERKGKGATKVTLLCPAGESPQEILERAAA